MVAALIESETIEIEVKVQAFVTRVNMAAIEIMMIMAKIIDVKDRKNVELVTNIVIKVDGAVRHYNNDELPCLNELFILFHLNH